MNHDNFFDTIDKNREEYFREKYHAQAYPENRELRKAQLGILKEYVNGGSAIEVMGGEGVLSLLANLEGILEVDITDKNENVLELLRKHVKSLGLEDKVGVYHFDIEEQTPIKHYNCCLAICTEMFNPNYPVSVEVLGEEYVPPEPKQFLKKFSKASDKIIVIEAYSKFRRFRISPEENIKQIAESVGLDAEVGKIEYKDGILYYGVLE